MARVGWLGPAQRVRSQQRRRLARIEPELAREKSRRSCWGKCATLAVLYNADEIMRDSNLDLFISKFHRHIETCAAQMDSFQRFSTIFVLPATSPRRTTNFVKNFVIQI